MDDLSDMFDLDDLPQPVQAFLAALQFCCCVCLVIVFQLVSRIFGFSGRGRRGGHYYPHHHHHYFPHHHHHHHPHHRIFWNDISSKSNFTGETKLFHDALNKDDSNRTTQILVTNLENNMRRNKSEIVQQPIITGTSISSGYKKVEEVDKDRTDYVTTDRLSLVDFVNESVETVKATMRSESLLPEYRYHGGVSSWKVGGASTELYSPEGSLTLVNSTTAVGHVTEVFLGNVSLAL